jgi:hypothetical protein
MLGWDRYGFHKNCVGTHCIELLFLHLVRSAHHVGHFCAPGHEMSTHNFSCSGGTSTDLTKSASGCVMPNLFFSHPEGSAGHIVHSGASGERNIDTLFFMLEWDQYGFDKKCITTRYAELLIFHPRSESSTQYFSSSAGTSTDSTKIVLDTLHRAFVFASGGICMSRSAFRCVRGVKCRRTIFHARVGPVRI